MVTRAVGGSLVVKPVHGPDMRVVFTVDLLTVAVVYPDRSHLQHPSTCKWGGPANNFFQVRYVLAKAKRVTTLVHATLAGVRFVQLFARLIAIFV